MSPAGQVVGGAVVLVQCGVWGAEGACWGDLLVWCGPCGQGVSRDGQAGGGGAEEGWGEHEAGRGGRRGPWSLWGSGSGPHGELGGWGGRGARLWWSGRPRRSDGWKAPRRSLAAKHREQGGHGDGAHALDSAVSPQGPTGQATSESRCVSPAAREPRDWKWGARPPWGSGAGGRPSRSIRWQRSTRWRMGRPRCTEPRVARSVGPPTT